MQQTICAQDYIMIQKQVCWNKNRNKWIAQYTRDKIKYNLGYFVDFDKAVARYNWAVTAPTDELQKSKPRVA